MGGGGCGIGGGVEVWGCVASERLHHRLHHLAFAISFSTKMETKFGDFHSSLLPPTPPPGPPPPGPPLLLPTPPPLHLPPPPPSPSLAALVREFASLTPLRFASLAHSASLRFARSLRFASLRSLAHSARCARFARSGWLCASPLPPTSPKTSTRSGLCRARCEATRGMHTTS